MKNGDIFGLIQGILKFVSGSTSFKLCSRICDFLLFCWKPIPFARFYFTFNSVICMTNVMFCSLSLLLFLLINCFL